MKREISNYQKHIQARIKQYTKVARSLVTGKRREEVFHLIVSQIEERTIAFLSQIGVDFRILDLNYLVEKPDLEIVVKNQKVFFFFLIECFFFLSFFFGLSFPFFSFFFISYFNISDLTRFEGKRVTQQFYCDAP